jgi:hypothetical protein
MFILLTRMGVLKEGRKEGSLAGDQQRQRDHDRDRGHEAGGLHVGHPPHQWDLATRLLIASMFTLIRCAISAFCGDAVRGPYVFWRCKNDLVICARCCGHVRDGLISDIVVCADLPASRERARILVGSLKNQRTTEWMKRRKALKEEVLKGDVPKEEVSRKEAPDRKFVDGQLFMRFDDDEDSSGPLQ